MKKFKPLRILTVFIVRFFQSKYPNTQKPKNNPRGRKCRNTLKLHTTNQTDMTNNFTSNLSRNCHSSIPKLWPLIKKILKNWIIGKKTANVKISPFRSVESTLNHQLIKPPVKTTLWLQNFNIKYLNLYKSKWVLTRRFILT